ncbi:LexA family protein [Pseudomonas caspiana]
MNETLGQRIKRFRKKAKMSQAELAKACGWSSQSRVGNYEVGSREPTLGDIETMAKAMGVEYVDLLMSSDDQAMANSAHLSDVAVDANVFPAFHREKKSRPYPVISWVEAGDVTEAPGKIGESHQWIESTESAGNEAYWLTVSGHSMTCNGNPSFPEGSLILVKPDADIINGKYYVVEMLDTGEKTFKQYVEDAGYRYLRPLNDKYRTIEIDNNCRFLGRVVDTKMTGL